ncbi:hypothetical protein CALCODRAFT_496576 [Calocera cornea HHB12733]|uniref:WKF domain-containing protein n=1 Tax=Calocera cornea HHB12733 TaxID=1353952 RepID=A0A165FR85_9BASI|nr:hypothetical protein CALCODRAFT_496576 [Calocera cornea HHB12733]
MARSTTDPSEKSHKRKIDEVQVEEKPAPVAVDVVELGPKTKKKRSKTSAAAAAADSTVLGDVETISNRPVSELAGTGAPGAQLADPSKKTRKRKGIAGEVKGVEEVTEPPKKKKKSKKAEAEVETQPAITEPASPAKKKKVTDAKAKAEDATKETKIKEAKIKKKKDKSKVLKSSLPDPKEDETLSDTAKKAINYARDYALSVADPPTPGWKFNKNSQTWLIKNALDPNIVTDPYMDAAFKYLRTVKGGALPQLEELCQSVLDAPEAVAEVQEKEDQEPLLQRYSKDRARALLGLLQSTG